MPASSEVLVPSKHLVILIALCTVSAMTGCQSGPPAKASDPTPTHKLLDRKQPDLDDHMATLATVRHTFAPSELGFLHEHIREVEQWVNTHLPTGDFASVWLAAYFRTHSSLPLLRERLLTDRYFYGWEGPDYNDKQSYLLDEQYPNHLAYITAIEAIAGEPLWLAFQQEPSLVLTPAELDALKSEADTDSVKEVDAHRLCVRWLLRKLIQPTGTWHDGE